MKASDWTKFADLKPKDGSDIIVLYKDNGVVMRIYDYDSRCDHSGMLAWQVFEYQKEDWEMAYNVWKSTGVPINHEDTFKAGWNSAAQFVFDYLYKSFKDSAQAECQCDTRKTVPQCSSCKAWDRTIVKLTPLCQIQAQ